MLAPLDFENRSAIEKLQRKRRLTAFVIIAEHLTLGLWRPVSWALFFAALWLFHIPSLFGQVASVFTTTIFAGGLVYLFYKDGRNFRLPSENDIDQRIEQESHVRHRPVSGLKDKLINPKQPLARYLWDKNRTHILALLPKLKTAKPQAFMARSDPYGLRFGALLFFGLGVLVAGPAWKDRIWNGLTPLNLKNEKTVINGITLWIEPPAYTQMSQIVLQNTKETPETLEIPTGSILKLRVHGGWGEPSLHIDDKKWSLEYVGEDNYTLETTVPNGQSFKIKQLFFTRAQWDYVVVPDDPPQITLSGEPETLPHGKLRFPFMLYDDYGVRQLRMTMKSVETSEKTLLGEHAWETRSVMSPAKTEIEINPTYDLSGHPWAGLPVTFHFTGEDDVGQNTSTPSLTMTLPERKFMHPIAKRLITLRKKLIHSPEKDYKIIAGELEALLRIPESFQHDIIVFLGIRTASSRLFYADPSTETAEALIGLLWNTALRIEDGNLTLAAQNLRDAQMALENALQNPDITNQEIAKLMHDLRQATAEYFMELQREMQKQIAEGQKFPIVPPEMFSKMINPDALASFLDQLESNMLSGDKNSAQEMLAQLQHMLDMMDPSMAGPMPPDIEMMSEGINELQQLIERQEALLKQTRNQVDVLEAIQDSAKSYGQSLPTNKDVLQKWGLENIPPAPGEKQNTRPPPSVNTQNNKTEQEALRYILGQLMLEASEVLNNIPENMALAEQEMRSSSDNLGQNRPDLSIPYQEKALEHLKEAGQQLSGQLMARLQQMTGMAFSGGGIRYDPLGRPYGGHGDHDGVFPGSRVKIPDERQRKQAQEILKILRQRSGELNRPDAELDYYRRLLKIF